MEYFSLDSLKSCRVKLLIYFNDGGNQSHEYINLLLIKDDWKVEHISREYDRKTKEKEEAYKQKMNMRTNIINNAYY